VERKAFLINCDIVAISNFLKFAKMAFTLRAAKGKNFVDRKELVNEMVKTLSDERQLIGYALYGQRRIGKSSLLKEVKRRLGAKENMVVVYYSQWKKFEGTVTEFAHRLSQEIIKEYGPKLGLKYRISGLVRSSIGHIREVLSDLNLTVKTRADIEFMLTFDPKKKTEIDPLNLVENAFNLAEQIAKETNTRCVIMLDEFPEIMKLKLKGREVGENIFKLIRTIHEDQENTILNITGSVKSTMEAAALLPTSPFYRQFIVKQVMPLENRYIKKIILDNLQDSKIDDDALDLICKFSGGIPFYAQFIGRELRGKKRIDAKDISDAVDELLCQEGELIFRKEYEDLSPKERLIVVDMAINNTSRPSDIGSNIGEDRSTIGTYMDYLGKKAVVRKEGRGKYSLEDSIFKMWVERNFPD